MHFNTAQQEAALPFDGYRILVADDNIINYQIAVRMLEKLGCCAEIATSGDEAIVMHEQQAYDLILMDCQMSGLDGYQATSRIRAAETGRRRVPIVAWTTGMQQDQRDKCLAAGMDDLMTKPLRPPMLQEMLARWLRMADASQSAACDAEGDELAAMQVLFGANFSELAALYQTDTPQRIAALYSAIAGGDALQITKIAHVMTGSCASIGATRLAKLCRDLEIRAKDGFPENSDSLLNAIQAEYARVAAKIQAMLQSPAM